MSKHEDKAVATFTTVVQKCDGCDGLHEPYISCDQVGSIDKRKEPSKAVAPHRITEDQLNKIVEACYEYMTSPGDLGVAYELLEFRLAKCGITVEEPNATA